VSAPIVTFDRVWKKFRRGERHDSLRDLIPGLAKGLFRTVTQDQLTEAEFWAVEDVSFAVGPGEALGIIGPNGAGKSTTLKLLTRIMRPNRGACVVRGRIGALIEIAAGFHPDLTGRENIFLQGAVMGMKRAEVTTQIDQIVEFAGVEDFIDTQVKRYSSGMNSRLGFAIAAHLNPDVLIIDEVLSVGDMAFQEKCIERMHAFKRQGTAIVFVSHNLQAVASLCDQALYLNRSCRTTGPTAEVIDAYVRNNAFAPAAEGTSGDIRIAGAALQTADGGSVNAPIAPGEILRLVVDFEVVRTMDDLTFAMVVHRSTDQLVVYDAHFKQEELAPPLSAGSRFRLEFELAANLTRGQYYFDVFAQYSPTQQYVARLRPAAHLAVQETRTFQGVADLRVRARMMPLQA
jgi:lipopolysaccharide transport system ATP-binding protein